MKITLWGTRGSVAAPGPDTVRYGGNTSCVEVRGADGTVLILDAGTGIRRLGTTLESEGRRVDLLLSHLHMDHIQGLGFFRPLDQPDREVHVWGPPSTTLDLRARLGRYLSPPLFPVRLRDLACSLTCHDVPLDTFEIGPFAITAALVVHPGPTVGYRITEGSATLAYVPDHEPALGDRAFPGSPVWTSGFDLVADADLLIHDTQYTADEYRQRVGWGHSAIEHALALAGAARVRRLVTFHHDPAHDDDTLDRRVQDALARGLPFELWPGIEGATFNLRPGANTLAAGSSPASPAGYPSPRPHR
jgi:phosphoribosyl 1,2-cyclic phosphodiesterase